MVTLTEEKAAELIYSAVKKLSIEEFQTLVHWILTSYAERSNQAALRMLMNMSQCLNEGAEQEGTRH